MEDSRREDFALAPHGEGTTMAATFKRATQMSTMAATMEQSRRDARGFSLKTLLRPASGGSKSELLSFSWIRFTTPGVVRFVCEPHAPIGMAEKITIRN